jgi:hypothetical protein
MTKYKYAIILLVLLLTFPQQQLSAQAQITGVVFEDTNSNSNFDTGESGIPGVVVSNGLDVVLTNQNGEYSLSVDDETMIFISKPAEYDLPVNAFQIPRFYYNHDPDGSPDSIDFRFPVVEPTGKAPESVNFPLIPASSDQRFRALAFADPQAGTHEQLDYVRDDIIVEAAGYEADFAMVVGDLVNDNLALFPRHLEIFAQLDIPVWNVPGNHDMNFQAPDDIHATETYERYFGPTNYSFNYGNVHFIAMDNVQYKGLSNGNYSGGARYRGYFTDKQLQWLENDLKHVPEDKLIVLFAHIPLKTHAPNDGVVGGDNINTVNLRELLKILDRFEKVYSFSGHDTSNSWQIYFDQDYGRTASRPMHHHIMAEVRGGSWQGPKNIYGIPDATAEDGNPNGYYLIDFHGAEYIPKFKAEGYGDDYRMRIIIETGGKYSENNRLPQSQLKHSRFLVNVFDGGDKWKVDYSLNGGSFSAMEYEQRPDPFVEHLLEMHRKGETSISINPSSHIWLASMPKRLRPGAHSLTVHVTTPFDETFTGNFIFEVE